MDAVALVTLGTKIVAGASVLHTILPPWEALDEFPASQRYYRLFVYVVGYVALNGRSTLYKSISTNAGTAPSEAAAQAAAKQGWGNGAKKP